MDQSSHALPGSDALPEPELAGGACLGFQKAHSFSKVPYVSADRLTDCLC